MTTAPEAAPNQFIVQHPSSECGFGVELKADGTFPTLKQAQERVIQEALRRCGNNQAKAARLLGISRQALNRRLNTAR
jgi:DNA-binding NtrC family response regulator